MLDTMFLLMRMSFLSVVWVMLHFWRVAPHLWVRDVLGLPVSLVLAPVAAWLISRAPEEVQEEAIKGAAYGTRSALEAYGCSERWIVYITGT